MSPALTAVFNGFLIGILVYSAAKHFWGLVTLIPPVSAVPSTGEKVSRPDLPESSTVAT